ncbi:ABC transporter ATP-binding protein [Robertmurraya siralis]|uniref:ABC transporter ATP-binding protein n=1 Tax=Robertmurraya siralis TaxID=77777 RepID=UPI0010F70426|nr:ABC transporter ATP-binding protein [Robertmurraya siralis]
MTNHYLELNGVSKTFSGFKLDNISFSLPKGYIMGLVGTNGAGKTTTIQLILNMLKMDSGQIQIFGHDHVKYENVAKQYIGVVFDHVFYVDSWTVKDTERAISSFYHNWRHDVFNEMLRRFDLPLEKKVGELSRGMQMKLMLACAMSHDPKLLILDEPTSGLDPVSRDELLEMLQEYIQDGERSVLFSTHITSDLERIADYITFIHQGQIVCSGKMDDFLGRFRLIKGRHKELTSALQERIIGLRITDMGFEGLIDIKEATKYKHLVLDAASIDDIMIHIGKRK